MIRQITQTTALLWVRNLSKTCTGMRMSCAYACYGVTSAACRFYLVDETGALMIHGQSALFCGAPGCEEELSAFLSVSQVTSFESESILLPDWTPVPKLLMHKEESETTTKVDTMPDLWKLKQSGLLNAADADGFYADACTRTNKGFGKVHAIQQEGQYIAMAYAQCITQEAVYLTAVKTLPAFRKQGYAAKLLGSFQKPSYLLCETQMRHFYEKQNFTLVHPVCAFKKEEAK